MKYCPYCGKEVSDESVICVSCGRQLGSSPGIMNGSAGYYGEEPSKPATVSTGFGSAFTGLIFILIGELLGNLNIRIIVPLMNISESGYGDHYITVIIELLLQIIAGAVLIAGLIMCIKACSKIIRSETAKPFGNLPMLADAYKHIEMGIIVMIAVTFLYFIGIFSGSAESVVYIIHYSTEYTDAYSGLEIFAAVAGILLRLVNFVGIIICIIGCSKGKKASAGI